MKILIISSFISVFLIIGHEDRMTTFPDFRDKIEKLIHKQWKGWDVELKEVTLNEELGSGLSDRQVYRLNHQDSLLGFLVLSRAYGCHEGGCNDETSVADRVVDSSYEIFYYAVLFNREMNIELVRILQYESEFGYEICGKRWLGQFRGSNGCELEYGQQIDGISGATVSAKSITYDINNLCWIMSDFAKYYFPEK